MDNNGSEEAIVKLMVSALAISLLLAKRKAFGSNRNDDATRDKTKLLIYGIDIGGTNIKAVAMNPTNRAIECQKVLKLKNTKPSPDELLREVIDIITQMDEELLNRPITGVGICCPGKVENNIVSTIASFGWTEDVCLDFPNKLREKLPQWKTIPIRVANDAKAALSGEMWFLPEHERTDVVLITIGTGIGSSACVGGKVLRGSCGFAGEIGHSILNFTEAKRCSKSTGVYGIAEEYIGAHGIINTYLEVSKTSFTTLTVSQIFDLAQKENNQTCLQVVEFTSDALAALIINVARYYDPGVVILAGGIAESGDFFMSRVKHYVEKRMWSIAKTSFKIIPSRNGYYSGAVGASSLVVCNFL